MKYWLLKTEPETYSFARLLKDKKTHWDGVRNFQARNVLREIALGDLCVIYHSGDDKAAVGVARVSKTAYPDIDPETPGDWVQIDIQPVEAFPRHVTLAEIKATPALAEMPLIRQSRLSCMPITRAHFDLLARLAKQAPPATGKTKRPVARAASR